jgi:WD40 repeat protein
MVLSRLEQVFISLLCFFGFSLLPAFAQISSDPSVVIQKETGMHTAVIKRIDMDAKERYLVTASLDKTVRVWSLLDEGKPVQIFRPPIARGEEGKFHAVAMSPDGNTVAAGGSTGKTWGGTYAIYLFDLKTGEMIRRLPGHSSLIFHLAYSPDGRYLVASLAQGGIRVYRTADYRLQVQDTDYGNASYWADFDQQGRLVTSSWDGFIRLYDQNFQLLAKRNAPGGNQPFAVDFSPTGAQIAVGFADSFKVNVLSGMDLSLLYEPPTQEINGQLNSVAWSQDGRSLYTGGMHLENQKTIILRWTQDEQGQFELEKWPTSSNTILDIRPMRDGGIVFGTFDPAFGRFDANGRKILYRDAGLADFRNKSGLQVSKEGGNVRFNYGARPGSFSIQKRTLAVNFLDKLRTILSVPITQSPNFEIAGDANTADFKINGQPVQLQPHEVTRSFATTPDEQQILVGSDWSLQLLDKKGQQQWIKSIPYVPWDMNIAGNGQVAVIAFGDGTLRWHRVSDGEELLIYFPYYQTVDGEAQQRWIIWASEKGYYMASQGGENLIGWHVNRGPDKAAQFFPIKKFREFLYRPDIVQATLKLRDIDDAILLSGDLAALNQAIKKVASDYSQTAVYQFLDDLKLADAVRSSILPERKLQLLKEKSEKDPTIRQLQPPEVVKLALVDLPSAKSGSRVINNVASRGITNVASRSISGMVSRESDIATFSTPTVELRYRVRLPSKEPITTLTVLANGRPVASVSVDPDKVGNAGNEVCDLTEQTRGIGTSRRVSKSSRGASKSSRGVSNTSSRGVSNVSSRGVSNVSSRAVGNVSSRETGGNDASNCGISSVASGVSSTKCQLPKNDGGEYRVRVSLPQRDVEVGLLVKNRFTFSEPITMKLKWTGDKSESVQPTLYVLTIGVSDYDDDELDLNYAAKDAEDFANALLDQKRDLYKDIIVRQLPDASKQEVLDGLGWLQSQAQYDDVSILFLAGHGVNVCGYGNNNTGGRYYFVPRDFDTKNQAETGVVFKDIKNTIMNIPGRVSFFLDTCHSGNVMGDGLVDVDYVSNDYSNGEREGVAVLTATTGEQLALESPDWGNGAFTKTLLEGLEGEADTMRDQKISFNEIDNHVSDGVEQLTEGQQTPMVFVPKGSKNFNVASTPE